MEKEFVSSDVYLSAVISLLLNTDPAFKVENNRTLFVFPVSDDLYRVMGDYNAGIKVNASELVAMIKRLRAEMILRRNMEAGRW